MAGLLLKCLDIQEADILNLEEIGINRKMSHRLSLSKGLKGINLMKEVEKIGKEIEEEEEANGNGTDHVGVARDAQQREKMRPSEGEWTGEEAGTISGWNDGTSRSGGGTSPRGFSDSGASPRQNSPFERSDKSDKREKDFRRESKRSRDKEKDKDKDDKDDKDETQRNFMRGSSSRTFAASKALDITISAGKGALEVTKGAGKGAIEVTKSAGKSGMKLLGTEEKSPK